MNLKYLKVALENTLLSYVTKDSSVEILTVTQSDDSYEPPEFYEVDLDEFCERLPPPFENITPVEGLPPDMASNVDKYLYGDKHEHIWEDCLDCDALILLHRYGDGHKRCSICGETD